MRLSTLFWLSTFSALSLLLCALTFPFGLCTLNWHPTFHSAAHSSFGSHFSSLSNSQCGLSLFLGSRTLIGSRFHLLLLSCLASDFLPRRSLVVLTFLASSTSLASQLSSLSNSHWLSAFLALTLIWLSHFPHSQLSLALTCSHSIGSHFPIFSPSLALTFLGFFAYIGLSLALTFLALTLFGSHFPRSHSPRCLFGSHFPSLSPLFGSPLSLAHHSLWSHFLTPTLFALAFSLSALTLGSHFSSSLALSLALTFPRSHSHLALALTFSLSLSIGSQLSSYSLFSLALTFILLSLSLGLHFPRSQALIGLRSLALRSLWLSLSSLSSLFGLTFFTLTSFGSHFPRSHSHWLSLSSLSLSLALTFSALISWLSLSCCSHSHWLSLSLLSSSLALTPHSQLSFWLSTFPSLSLSWLSFPRSRLSLARHFSHLLSWLSLFLSLSALTLRLPSLSLSWLSLSSLSLSFGLTFLALTLFGSHFHPLSLIIWLSLSPRFSTVIGSHFLGSHFSLALLSTRSHSHCSHFPHFSVSLASQLSSLSSLCFSLFLTLALFGFHFPRSLSLFGALISSLLNVSLALTFPHVSALVWTRLKTFFSPRARLSLTLTFLSLSLSFFTHQLFLTIYSHWLSIFARSHLLFAPHFPRSHSLWLSLSSLSLSLALHSSLSLCFWGLSLSPLSHLIGALSFFHSHSPLALTLLAQFLLFICSATFIGRISILAGFIVLLSLLLSHPPR
ncbi:hypothetical protein C7M84_008525 [Penaeus vannamei]|uniref:Uncharacterized protein n=1 Tax=Penaeus vannamei TaxID=6689 RepID=A0A423T9B3_PENVA|nr:hypothetical protein C7M84_008525 [Penaeus vannamei]